MKRIFKFIILLVICFLPVMVDAKATFEYSNRFINEFFLYKENNDYYFANYDYYEYEDGSIKVYDREKNIIKNDKFINGDYSIEAVVSSKYFSSFYKLESSLKNIVYDPDNKIIYNIDYGDEYFYYYTETGTVVISFDKDIEFTKKLLGKKYDIYLLLKDTYGHIKNISEFNGYYVLYYKNYNNYVNYTVVYDEDLNVINYFEDEDKDIVVGIFNDLLYVMKDNRNLAVYTLNGDKVGELNIDGYQIFDDDEPTDYYCGKLYPVKIDVVDDELFILFERFLCPERVNYDDESFYDSAQVSISVERLTLKYEINYEIDKVESNNGDFTYVEKEDEDGKSYVELKITPKNGYIVDKIIVTDTNGNKIEVTDNKFYKPLNDIKIEVQYKIAGEYVPIPDTFLGKSITLIFIGLILIGLGVYTVNYVKN